MAKEPETKPAGAAPVEFIITSGVLVTRDKKGRSIEQGPGEVFSPADDEERDSLIRNGRIARADSAAAASARLGAGAIAGGGALEAALGRADDAEARAADLQSRLDAANERIVALEAAAGPAAVLAATTPAK